MLLEKRYSISAAVYVVPGVETQAQFIGGKQGKETINFLGCFHMASGMMVKRYPETDCLALGNHFSDSSCRRLPLRVAPGQLICFIAPARCGISVGRNFIGENQQASASLANQAGRTRHIG